MRKHFYLLIAAVLALLFSFNACGGDDDVSVTGVTLNKVETSMTVGATEQLTATIQPANATNTKVSWTSSDDTVATVSDSGGVRAAAPGAAMITAATDDGNYIAACAVFVNLPSATGVTLNKQAAQIAAGMEERLTATVSPAGANQTVTWASSNQAVASVAPNGNFIAVAAGIANITATTADGGFKATCAVTVTPASAIAATGVILKPASLTIDKNLTVQFIWAIDPPNAPASGVTWGSSNAAVATVSNTGFMTAVGPGSAEITATVGDAKGTCPVTVNPAPPVSGVTLNSNSAQMERNGALQLTANVIPAHADNRAVTWSTSDNAMVSVSPSGLVTAGNNTGKATITVRTSDGGFTAECAVTVMEVVDKVYVGGQAYNAQNRYVATLWVNGVAQNLSDGSLNNYVESVFVTDNGDVHAAGYEVNAAGNYVLALWKNGVRQTLESPGGNGFGEAYSVVVKGDDVYVAGSPRNAANNGYVAGVWKNGVLRTLDDRSYSGSYGAAAFGVFVTDNGDVYVAGDETSSSLRRDIPTLWKIDGATQNLTTYRLTDGAYIAFARDIVVHNGKMYVGGGERNNSTTISYMATVWEIGEDGVVVAHRWSDGSTNLMVDSIFVSDDGAIYGAGSDETNYVAKVWKDGVVQSLPPVTDAARTYAHSVYVSNGDVYVAGQEGTAATARAILWKNGVPERYEIIQRTEARTVFVAPGH